MELSRTQRALVGAGLVCLVLGAFGSIWLFLASQSPSSPFHASFLPGPVQRFAFWSLASGFLLLVLAVLVPHLVAERRQRAATVWLLVGTTLKLVGLGLGAYWSVYGIQIIDPRPKSVVVMSIRILGELAVLSALVWIAVGWFRHRQRS